MRKDFYKKEVFLAEVISFADKWDWSRPLSVKLEQLRRKEILSKKFHAMCDDFEDSPLEWAGKRRESLEWKNLLISGHSKITKEDCELVIGLEGEILNIRESTSAMTNERILSLISYTEAYGANNGVVFKDSKYDDYPEAG